jgi:hypothetical protein
MTAKKFGALPSGRRRTPIFAARQSLSRAAECNIAA